MNINPNETYRELRTRMFFEKMSKRKTKKGCILWKGSPQGGRGNFKWLDGKQHRPARVSYEIHYGSFDKKLLVCHTCDVGLCVNPKHLFLGTAKDNIQDMINKGRAFFQKDKYRK